MRRKARSNVIFHAALQTFTGCSNTDFSRALDSAWSRFRPCRVASKRRNAAPAPGARLKNEMLLPSAPTKIHRSSAGATSYNGAISTRTTAAMSSSFLPTQRRLSLILTVCWFSYARAAQTAVATPTTPTKKMLAYIFLRKFNDQHLSAVAPGSRNSSMASCCLQTLLG